MVYISKQAQWSASWPSAVVAESWGGEGAGFFLRIGRREPVVRACVRQVARLAQRLGSLAYKETRLTRPSRDVFGSQEVGERRKNGDNEPGEKACKAQAARTMAAATTTTTGKKENSEKNRRRGEDGEDRGRDGSEKSSVMEERRFTLGWRHATHTLGAAQVTSKAMRVALPEPGRLREISGGP
jgi:hypothetical protein